MATPSKPVILIVAMLAGLIAALGIYQIVGVNGGRDARRGSVAVVVATTTLTPGVELTEGHLRVEPRPRAELPAGTFTQQDAVIGRVAKRRIQTNEPIVEAALAPAKSQAILGATVPAGYRAMGIFADARGGIQEFLHPGDHVDVIVTMVEKDKQRLDLSSSQLVLQDVQVLAIPDAGSSQKKERQRDQVPVVPVTVAVTPLEAEKLSLAMELGVIQLVVRGYDEKQLAKTSGVTRDTLLPGNLVSQQEAIARRGEPLPTYRLVEVIRGGERQQQRFREADALWVGSTGQSGAASSTATSSLPSPESKE